MITVEVPFSEFTDREHFFHEFTKTIDIEPDSSLGMYLILAFAN